MSSNVVEYSDVVFTKHRLIAEWNFNRFAHNLTRPGEVIMYQGPGDDFEHPLYVNKDGSMLPVDRATGKPIYTRINTSAEAPADYAGATFPVDLVVDRNGNYVRHYSDNTYVTINDVKIAVGSDDIEVTDENGDALKISPDGKVIPLGDEGLPQTTVQNGDEVVLNADGTVMVNDITGAPVKLAEIFELSDSRPPVSVANHPRLPDGTLQDPSRSTRYFDYDSDLFPLDSIIQPDRPKKKGLQKAWARSKERTQSYTTDFYYPGRFYTASVDAKFKYWVPNDAASVVKRGGGDTAGYPIQDVGVWVNYDRPHLSNKIVIGVDPVMNESSEENRRWAEPTWSRVFIEVDNGEGLPSWVLVKENPKLNDCGKIILYCNSTDYQAEWVDDNCPDMAGDWEPDLTNGLNIMSIRYEVYRMAEPGVRVNLIEMSLRLERDLSDRLSSWSVDASMSDHSFVAPFGRISSNSGSVVLDNMDGQFDNDAKYLLNDSMFGDIVSTRRNEFHKIIDRGIDLRLDLAVSDKPIVDGQEDWDRQFTMTADNWTLSEGLATAELKDDSELLQRLKPGPVFIEQFRRHRGRPVKLTAMEVIFQLLDLVGYNNIRISGDYDQTVPMDFYWTDGEATVWDCIASICESTQMSVYFDRFGVMQFQPLKTLYDEPQDVDKAVLRTIDITKPSDPSGYYPANIVSLNKDGEYEANTINITYKKTHLAETTDSGIEKLQQVWEPDSTQVLRASALVAPLKNLDRGEGGADYSVKIAAEDVKTWPFEGIVNIEGELIRYNAKKYYYYGSGGKYRWKYVRSQEEVDKLNDLNPKLAYKNHYNGRLRIKERGLWNTQTKAHKVDVNGWWCRKRTGNGRVVEWYGGLKHDKNHSALLLRAPKTFKKNSIYVAMNGDMDDVPIKYYGCRMKYPKSGYSYGAAGIAVGLGTHDCGIYIELARTSAVSKEKRKQGNELRVWLRQKNGKLRRWGKGQAVAVARAKWYDIDVFYAKQGSQYLVEVMVNGVSKHTFQIDNPGYDQFDGLDGARYGMFVRGNTDADFEYFYACNRFEQEGLDSGGFFDRINNGWQSQSAREYTLKHRKQWRYDKRKNERVRERYSQLLFDDFGPIVHEVREYDVKFDGAPATFSKLYFTNDSQAYCTEYKHSAFGAQFIMVNGSRNNAVLNGDDNLTYGKENTLNQKMMIFGRAVQQDDESRIVLRDEGAVSRRGEVSLDFNTEWVQSESAANTLASYILGVWSRPSYGYNVEIFGDPRIDLGDRVALYAPEQGIGTEGALYSDVKNLNTYIVNEIHQDYDNGLSTTLNLRSITPAPPYESISEQDLLIDNNLIFNAKINQHDGDIATGWLGGSAVDESYVLTHEPSFGSRSGLLRVQGTYDNGTDNTWVNSYVEPQRYMPGQTTPVRRFSYVNGDYYYAEVQVHAAYDSYIGLRIYGYGGTSGENNGQIAMNKVRIRAGETKTVKIAGKFTKSGLTEVAPLVYFFKADGKHGAVKRNKFYISRMFFQTGEDEADTKPTW